MCDFSYQRRRGFTLIEVLVALVVIALGMLGAIEAVNQSISTSAYLRDRSIAQWVAMNKLTETRLLTTPPKVDKTSGDAEMAGQKYRWNLAVTQAGIETMLRLDVTVNAAGTDESKVLASVTGFYSTSITHQPALLQRACLDPDNPPPRSGGPSGGGATPGSNPPPDPDAPPPRDPDAPPPPDPH